MKFITALATSAVFASTFLGATAQDLKAKYAIRNLDLIPDPDGNPSRFLLSAKMGRDGENPQGNRMVLTWDPNFTPDLPLAGVCRLSGATDLPHFRVDKEDGAILEGLGITRNSYIFDGAVHTAIMDLTLNDNILTSPMLKPIDETTAVIRFCAVFAAEDHGVIINSRQMAVEMTINLEGSFSVADVELNQVGITEDTGDQVTFGVTAENCGADLVYLPGEPICVRVCASNYPATSIVDFVSMPLAHIENSALHETYENTKDVTDCVGGGAGEVECCEIETVLSTSYFPSVFGEATTVNMAGSVTLAISGQRRLVRTTFKADRSLEEKHEEGFATKVVLLSSGASSLGLGFVGLVLTAVHVFLA